MTGYTAPDVSAEKVTPTLVRDELLKCFESANSEFMVVLKQPVDDQAIRAQVYQFVTGVFQNCGVSFADPSKAGILTAINQCKANAESMMGPAGSSIIAHHYAEMIKLVDQLPDAN
ncbi:MAG: hypothetical protein ABSA72_07690 [Nitrososphaerales archaeon]|jgi:hypothetical protein